MFCICCRQMMWDCGFADLVPGDNARDSRMFLSDATGGIEIKLQRVGPWQENLEFVDSISDVYRRCRIGNLRV